MLSIPLTRGAQDIGPYHVLEDLGLAPFGTAYRAADTRSDRTVVLKVIRPSRPSALQEAVSWEILLAETEALGWICHPGLPSLLEIAERKGSLLISFTQAEGRTLRELLAQGGRPDRATLVDWGAQLLEILATAHAQGILHRHLTEYEVIVTPEGRLALTGFGLTRLVLDSPAAPTPEQLAGELDTAQSDLYAVGSLLRRLAFGSLGARDPLLKVLARAACVDPATRYESAVEMAEALREAGRAGAGTVPRLREPATGSACRVASFPGASPRPAAAAPLPSGASRCQEEDEQRDLWRALVLLVVSLLLMTFVLVTGWFLLGEGAKRKTRADDSPGFHASPSHCQFSSKDQMNLSPPKLRTSVLQTCK